MTQIGLAVEDSEIQRCFSVVKDLRPHLLESEFVSQVKRQQQQGYRLAYLDHKGQVRAVAGFRIAESLAWGHYLYIDDLVTHSSDRSKGYGNQLFNWLIEYARSHGCEQLHLDSGVQRSEAHRFYFRQRMHISSYHFSMKV